MAALHGSSPAKVRLHVRTALRVMLVGGFYQRACQDPLCWEPLKSKSVLQSLIPMQVEKRTVIMGLPETLPSAGAER